MNIIKRGIRVGKDFLFSILTGVFVLFSSIVIHISKAEHDTWPSLDEMQSTNTKKVR